MTHAQDCIFCAIASGRAPAAILCEDADLVAFMDIFPVRPGHVQIVPRAHHSYFDDLPLHLGTAIFALGQRIARAQKALLGAPRVAFAYVGADVAHVHAQLIPVHEIMDITSQHYIEQRPLTLRRPPMAPLDELARVADRLRAAMA